MSKFENTKNNKQIFRIIFGIGSNLGNKALNLDLASEKLENYLELKEIKKSNIFQNPAMLLEGSPQEWDIDFFNIALSANINLEKFPPEEILKIIKNIEQELGRKNNQKWSPRPIDIDILAIENLEIKIENLLQIPHQDFLKRDFFVKTVKEIEPTYIK